MDPSIIANRINVVRSHISFVNVSKWSLILVKWLQSLVRSFSYGHHFLQQFSQQFVTMSSKPPISTHVLDTAKGQPVTGLQVSLYKLIDGRWTYINEGVTSTDGRYTNFVERTHFTPGRYKLHYDVDRYFESRKMDSLYPFIEVSIKVLIWYFHLIILFICVINVLTLLDLK